MRRIAVSIMLAIAAAFLLPAGGRDEPNAPPEGVNAKNAAAALVPKKPETGDRARPADPLKVGY